MTGRQRIALLVAAAVVLVGAFVVFGNAAENDDTTATTPATTTQAESAPEPESEEPAPAAKPKPRVERIRIPASGEPRTLRFKSGETVRLRFSAVEPAEVHLHGYDRTVELPAGGSKTLTFKATAEGIFEIEDHHTHQLLAKLEVRPS